MKKGYLFILFCTAATVLHAGLQVDDTQVYQQEGSSTRIFKGVVELPGRGIWYATTNHPGMYVLAPHEAYQQLTGRRMAEAMSERRLNQGRYTLGSINWICRQYAQEHDGIGPSGLSDLDPVEHRHYINRFEQLPWGGLPEGMDLSGPYAFLIPDVPFTLVNDEQHVRRENRVLMAFELRPYIDDGKHWIAYSDGATDRVAIDPELVARYGQKILPVFPEAPHGDELPASYMYTVLTFLGENDVAPLSISITNEYAMEEMALAWDLSSAGPGDETILEEVRELQVDEWSYQSRVTSSPVLRTWLSLNEQKTVRSPRNLPRRGANTSAFGVMGGYAAIRETLQMQLIDTADTPSQKRTVPVDSLEGVKVKSHPYDEMLDGATGGRLSLAELAPQDHFFVYLSRPEAMLPLLDSGADYLSELGMTATGNNVKYYLKDRYLRRLGTNEAWLKRFIESGGISECAVFAPDMFFIDGTEITVAARMANARLIIPLLRVLGIPALSDQKIVEVDNGAGENVYWTIRDDLLLMSTRKAELKQVVDLHANAGAGSLGKSAEFRYMLKQLPVSEETRAYAYLSDAFIRKLVGPVTKIGQLRRVKAISNLTLLSSGALLARLDGFGQLQSIDELQQRGYLPDAFEGDPSEYSLDEDLVAHSKTYGTLARMASISATPVEMVTEDEAKSYTGYVDNYSRFWRQFFDPIALRLNNCPDGSLEAGVFILPLIDSSIYNGIREYVMAAEDGRPLRTPRFSPDPVLQFSINLKEEAWRNVSSTMSEFFDMFTNVDPVILDDLGPGIHLALNDGDPVVALGSGDILGSFGGNGLWLGDEEMFFVPIALSVLTRPSTVAIETVNPERTITCLRRASGASYTEDDIHVEIYQVDGRDSWVCLFDIMGVLQLRYGLEVEGEFLMIRNIPWSSRDHIVEVEHAALNGTQLKVWPSACKLQLPGLYSTAAEKKREAALQGMGFLYPLLASGYAAMDAAFDHHMKLFGFAPQHVRNDSWSWEDDVLMSSRYGSIYRKKQPAYAGEEGFGLMGGLQDLALQMQFEDSGLRATIKWKMRGE